MSRDNRRNPSLWVNLASKANPMRGAVEPGVEPGLEATAYYGPPHGATGSGACAVILDIDPETFKPKIERFVIVHDCGTVINPLLLEGQIQGGVSMGIGNAFYEKIVYDENGQLLTASFMDYLMPQATDMPKKMEMGHLHTKSPLNPLGIKGVGEAGALPPGQRLPRLLKMRSTDIPMEILESNLNPSMVYEYVKKAAENSNSG